MKNALRCYSRPLNLMVVVIWWHILFHSRGSSVIDSHCERHEKKNKSRPQQQRRDATVLSYSSLWNCVLLILRLMGVCNTHLITISFRSIKNSQLSKIIDSELSCKYISFSADDCNLQEFASKNIENGHLPYHKNLCCTNKKGCFCYIGCNSHNVWPLLLINQSSQFGRREKMGKVGSPSLWLMLVPHYSLSHKKMLGINHKPHLMIRFTKLIIK